MAQYIRSIFAAAAIVLVASGRPSSSTYAKQACAPPAAPTLTQPNIFSEEQENVLGEYITEQLSRNFHIVDDDAVTSRLREIGALLLSHLPPTKIHFQFFVIDLPDDNAFSLPGGGIYVSRKIIAQTRSEDELAGLLGHEMGHVLSRQGSANTTRRLKALLNVTQLGDRRDIYDKMNQLQDNIGRKSGPQSDENADQMEADRLGLYAMAAAGYNPAAFASLFDRIADTQGRTGGFFSDLFGSTSADSKRLRELLKQSSSLPAACGPLRRAGADDGYAAWRTAVVSYTGLGRKESIPGLISKTTLDQPLTAEITNLRFSPDGAFVLAQDDEGISVLTRTPLQALFRIDAPDADDAFFTPDSTRLVYSTSSLRVESWRTSDHQLDAAYEVAPHPGCVQTALSPDGATLGCLDTDRAITLYAVATNAIVYQKPRFYQPSEVTPLFSIFFGAPSQDASGAPIAMTFSTDGRYFIAGHRRLVSGGPGFGITADSDVLAYDLKNKQTINLKGDVKDLVTTGFAFTGPDRFVALGVNRQQPSAFVTLPTGTIQKITLDSDPGFGEVSAATNGDFAFLRPFRQYAVGIVDLKQGKILQGSALSAIDVFDRTFVSERGNGDVGLYSLDTTALVAEAAMARTSLGRLRTVEVTPDFGLLAISERTRGAIWNLATHTVVGALRAFRGGYFDAAGVFYTDLPRSGTTPRQITRIDTKTKSGGAVAPVTDAVADQYGRFLIAKRRTLPTEKPAGVFYEVRDVTTGQSLWTRTFVNDPHFWVSPGASAIVFGWWTDDPHAREEAKGSAAIAQALAAIGPAGTGVLLDVVDARTGVTRTSLVIDTNRSSFDIRHAAVSGGWLWLEDTANRVHLYALDTGVEKGQVFGDWASIAANGTLSVENGPTIVAVYDLATFEKRAQYTFAHGILRSQLSPDGRRLFVLTSDQSVYLIDAGAGK